MMDTPDYLITPLLAYYCFDIALPAIAIDFHVRYELH